MVEYCMIQWRMNVELCVERRKQSTSKITREDFARDMDSGKAKLTEIQ
jgi:hypothetical protein